MKGLGFKTLDTIVSRLKDGSFNEVIDDWKWIFSYSRKYKGGILFYTVLGLLSTTMAVVSSIASKYLIDVIT